MQILITEDEISLAEALGQIVMTAGYGVDIVHNGTDALSYIASYSYDLVILDVMMRGIDGFEVVRRIREAGNSVPVLMLTARTATADKVTGLNAGADDYMVKPFETEELLARIRALTRRRGTVTMDELHFGDLSLRLSDGQLARGSAVVQLSRRELDLARELFTAHGTAITKEKLLDSVWGSRGGAAENSVEAYVSFLRKKMRFLQSAVTVRNIQKIGYRLEETRC